MTTEFSLARHTIGDVTVGPLVACGAGTDAPAYASFDGLHGARRFLEHGEVGAMRCPDGQFRTVNFQRPVCDLALPPVGPDAAVIGDIFFREVASEWKRVGIEATGIGSLDCGSETRPWIIAIGDYKNADRAATILVERARAWQLGQPLTLVVRGLRGSCEL